MDSAALERIVRALEGLGLRLGDGIESPDDLARRVEVAARNFAAGKRERKGWREQLDGAGD